MPHKKYKIIAIQGCFKETFRNESINTTTASTTIINKFSELIVLIFVYLIILVTVKDINNNNGTIDIEPKLQIKSK